MKINYTVKQVGHLWMFVLVNFFRNFEVYSFTNESELATYIVIFIFSLYPQLAKIEKVNMLKRITSCSITLYIAIKLKKKTALNKESVPVWGSAPVVSFYTEICYIIFSIMQSRVQHSEWYKNWKFHNPAGMDAS